MEIQRQNGTLTIHDIRELSADNARSFRNKACAALTPGIKTIEIDLSQTGLVDSCGLGALVSVFKAVNEENSPDRVTVRLLNPLPPVQQVLELTRMHHLFEIVLPNGDAGHGVTEPGRATKNARPA